jgi:hypothetical protein
MPRVMFTISYTVKPESRDSYLQIVHELKAQYAALGRSNYSVFEAKGKKGQFTEVFLAGSMEEYDALEDIHDERIESLVQRLQEFVDKGGMKYSTLVEME